MTRIFLSYSSENTICADQLRAGLEAQGFLVWHEPSSLDPKSASYPHSIEIAILGSASVILIWSKQAEQDTWIERHLQFAQSLKKPIFPIILDGSSLPNMLISIAAPVIPQIACVDAVATLLALPTFPPAHSTDALILLWELAAHKYIRERKKAIDQATDLLAHGEHQEEVLALLTYLAKSDAIMDVRETAQAVLDAEAKKRAPASAPFQPQDAQSIFGVRCKNGHVSYFDKRVVCVASQKIPRLVGPTQTTLDELYLTCDTCGVEIVAHVDCRGYV